MWFVIRCCAERHRPPRTGAAVTLFSAFATFGIALISWKFFEGPLVRLGHLFNYQPAAGIVMDLGPQWRRCWIEFILASLPLSASCENG